MTPTGFRLGEFVVEPATDRLLHVDSGTRIDLEPKTMDVLVALADRTGDVVSSETLIACVWHGRPMGDNPVYKAVAKLRRALHDDAAAPRYIETIPRKGYRLIVAPSIEPARSPADAAHAAVESARVTLVAAAVRSFAPLHWSHLRRAAIVLALLVATLSLLSLLRSPVPESVARPAHPTVAPTSTDESPRAAPAPHSHSIVAGGLPEMS